MAQRLPYKHSPEEGEGEQPWTIHVPVQPKPDNEWLMDGVPTTTEQLLRHLPAMIEEEDDPVQCARLERTVALVERADRLWKAGMRWAEAQAEAARWFPPLSDEEIERAKRQWRISSSSFQKRTTRSSPTSSQ